MDAVRAAINQSMIDGLNASALRAGQMFRKTLSQPGTGRIYRVAKGRRKGRNLRAKGFHQASAPGRPPAVNTNRLRASWSVDVPPGMGSRISAAGNRTTVYQNGPAFVLEFGSRIPYAPMLEYGTRRMKARPYIKIVNPLLARVVPRLFRDAINLRMGPGSA